MAKEVRIAYFSMEIGLEERIPTYSGGLGILAGDTLKAGADLGVPMIGVTLLSEKGYFTQHLDPATGQQTEEDNNWDVHGIFGDPLSEKVTVQIEGRDVKIQAWQYTIRGVGGATVPILYLDTNLEENDPRDRALTRKLYGGDQRYRLAQEVVLGIGGLFMLKALGHPIVRYHMNEGHAALLALELFRDAALHSSCSLDDFSACMNTIKNQVRTFCVFTTHTPVAAGHDQFPYDLVRDVLGEYIPFDLMRKIGGEEKLNMTLLAMNLSHFVNSVARQHQHVSQHLFPGYTFNSITNGIHSTTWTSDDMQRVFDRYIPNWRQDSFELRNALRIPEHEVIGAHQAAKRKLVQYVNKMHGAGFDEDTFTIGFARRAATYKRADLLFQDIQRLKKIGSELKLQIIFGGKAHPADIEGKELIKKIFWHMGEIKDTIRIVYLEDYDIEVAKLVIGGVDIWLNTPQRPKEASGTSGMKAAHNAVPQISILDGWWIEGHIEGVTGWEIGPFPTEDNEDRNDSVEDAEELYDKLEHIILPMYYTRRMSWVHVMRNSIAFNASFFNTHRMMQQYVLNAYLL